MILVFFFNKPFHPRAVWRGNSLNPSSWGMELLMEESSLGACAVVYSSRCPHPMQHRPEETVPPSQLAEGGNGRGARNDCKN